MAPRGTQAMLEFPRWKYFLILIVLAVSALYALPNIYQKDPAVQITANRGGQIDDALRDRVLADLKKAGVTTIGAEKEGDSLIVRLSDLKSQSAASDALRDSVGENYTVALNLASTVPDWLAKLGGRPMVLGLDLQGGVHFVLQVDQKAALDKRIDAYAEDARVTMRDKRVKYESVERRADNTIVVTLPEGQDPDSYCQALGGEAFSDYLNSNEETFIFFKAKLLISDTQNDPLRKSDAVRDILRTVALISDPLKRSALSQQLASICDIDQATLLQELSVLLKQQQLKERQDFVKEVSAAIDASGVAYHPEGEVAERIRVNLLEHRDQELALFRLLLLYGENEFSSAEERVFDFVWAEMQGDPNLAMEDALAKKLATEIEQSGGWPGPQHFIHHMDTEIAAWAAGVMADGHTLSPAYKDNYIDVKDEATAYKEQIVNMFLHLRRKKVDAMIENHLEMIKQEGSDSESFELMMEFLTECQ